MAFYVHDTFDGDAGELVDHVGQVGATWENHSVLNNGITGATIKGNGELLVAPQSYSYVRIVMPSGSPAGAEYDLRVGFHIYTFRGDGHLGVAFRVDPATKNYYRVVYSPGPKSLLLTLVVNDVNNELGSWTESPAPADGSFRNVEIRVRNASPKIAVYVDGVVRITSDNLQSTGGDRVGVYGWGSQPAVDVGDGILYTSFSLGSAGFVLPDYDVSGPAGGPPDQDSADFTATLVDGVNPGSLVITPSVTGVAGTFTPPTVTLTDGARSATFVFHPDVAGTATISFASSMEDAPDQSYLSALSPPDREAYWASRLYLRSSEGPSPYVAGTGYWLDGDDHYDPQMGFQKIQAYAVAQGLAVTDYSEQIEAGKIRYRDRAVRAVPSTGGETPGVPSWHVFSGGIAANYLETSDPDDVEAVGYLLGSTAAGYSVEDLWEYYGQIGAQRELAEMLQLFVDRAAMGLGDHVNLDLCMELCQSHVSQWAAPPETKRLFVWLKPFMGALNARAQIAFRDFYLDTEDATRAALVAAVPASIKAFCDYVWSDCWYPEGTPVGDDDWTHGSVKYVVPSYVDGSMDPITGLAITSVGPDPRRIFFGPPSLDNVDDRYTGTAANITGLGRSMVVGYEGATRKFTLGDDSKPGRDLTGSDTFAIEPSIVDLPLTGEGDGPSPDLNHMLFPAFAWLYRYYRVEEPDAELAATYRARAHAVFNGCAHCWEGHDPYQQKQYSQSAYWTTDGLSWLREGDEVVPAVGPARVLLLSMPGGRVLMFTRPA